MSLRSRSQTWKGAQGSILAPWSQLTLSRHQEPHTWNFTLRSQLSGRKRADADSAIYLIVIFGMPTICPLYANSDFLSEYLQKHQRPSMPTQKFPLWWAVTEYKALCVKRHMNRNPQIGLKEYEVRETSICWQSRKKKKVASEEGLIWERRMDGRAAYIEESLCMVNLSSNTAPRLNHLLQTYKRLILIYLILGEFLSWCSGKLNPSNNHENVGSIPGLAQWAKDLALPWALVQVADTAEIWRCCGAGWQL